MDAINPHQATGHRPPHDTHAANPHPHQPGPQDVGVGSDASQHGSQGSEAGSYTHQTRPEGFAAGPWPLQNGPQPQAGVPGQQQGQGWAGVPGFGTGPYAQQDGRQGAAWTWTARRKLMAAGAAMLIAVGAGGAGALGTMALTGNESSATGIAGTPVAAPGKSTIAQIAAAVQPSVVAVAVSTPGRSSEGSGVVLRPDGTIITNAHVVSNAARIQVKFSDGRTAPAEVLGTDTGHDIAVIKARGVSGLKAAALGDSGRLAVGDTVLAMGNPLGLDGSVTAGIVSALGRTLEEGDSPDQQGLPPGFGRQVRQESTTIRNAIQTDAAINPGNSGGALVNGSGQVVGINTAIATTGQGDGSIGVGFAIPINDAVKVVNEIISAS
ncbi:putative serine protease PepD [Thermomonospora echinospora]|uniref:Putative serine protease PepD n=2 Tax=Thermomonospora echinospora TaxID=1992 RepID=A0A1H6D1N5_9ACTN|nr:putative serine protease PepD [Thermomonospora echinospora]